MPGQLVTDCERHARKLTTFAETNLPDIEAGVEARAPKTSAAGKALASVGALLRFAMAEVESGLATLRAEEQSLDLELADDHAPRETRDALVTEIYDEVTAVRATIDGNYGKSALRHLGINGPTVRDATTLIRQAELLAQGANKLKSLPLRDGVEVNVGRLLSGLEAGTARLSAALQEVDREVQEASVARSRRDAAVTAVEERFTTLVSTLETGLHLAGLADRIAQIPSRHASSRKSADAEAPIDPKPSPIEPD